MDIFSRHTYRVPPPVSRKALFVATCSLAALTGTNSFAQEATPTATATPNTLSSPSQSRIVPVKYKESVWDTTTVGMALFNEKLIGDTFAAKGFGIGLSLDQYLRGPFSGGVNLRWGNWSPSGDSEDNVTIHPLLLISRVEASTGLNFLLGDTLGPVIRPLVAGGVGYLWFVTNAPDPTSFAKNLKGEEVVSLSLGVRLIWEGTLAVRLARELWRGVATSRYQSHTWNLELQLGGVSRD